MLNLNQYIDLISVQAGKKKGSKSAKSRKSSGASKKSKKSGKSSAKSGGSSLELEQRDPDMLDPPAMHNLYYIAHGPVDALEIRGFGWADAPKKKGKKGKKKK